MSMFGTGGVAIAGHHISYGLLAVLLSVPVAGLAIYQFRSGAIGGAGAVNTGTGTTSVDAFGNILDSNGNIIGQATGALGGGGGGGGGASDAVLAALSGNVSSLADLLRGMSPYSAPAEVGAPSTNYVSNRYVTMTKAADMAPATSSYQPTPSPTPGIASRTFWTPPPAPVYYAPSAPSGTIAQRTFYVAPAPAPAPAPSFGFTP